MDCTQVLFSESFEEVNATNEKLAVATLEVDGIFYAIYNTDNSIGRDDSCDIIIKNNTISSKHAIIEADDPNAHLLYDLGSTNKTKLGKVTLKPHVRYHINDGDQLTFGNVSALYNISRQYPVSPEKRHSQTVPETPEKEDVPSYIIPGSSPEDNDKSGLDTSDVDMFDNDDVASTARRSILGSTLSVNKKEDEENIYEMDTMDFGVDDILPSYENESKANLEKETTGDKDNAMASGSRTDAESIYDICTKKNDIRDDDLEHCESECQASAEVNSTSKPSSSDANNSFDKLDKKDVSIYDIHTQSPVEDEPAHTNISPKVDKKISLEWGDFPESPSPVGLKASSTNNLESVDADKFMEENSTKNEEMTPKKHVDVQKDDDYDQHKTDDVIEQNMEAGQSHPKNTIEPDPESDLDDIITDKAKLQRVVTDIVKQMEGSFIVNRESLKDTNIYPLSQNNDLFESFDKSKGASIENETLHDTSGFNDSDDEAMLNISTQMYPKNNTRKENDSLIFEAATQPMDADDVKAASNVSVVAIDETFTSSFFEAATQPVVENSSSKAAGNKEINKETNELTSADLLKSNLDDFKPTPVKKTLKFTETEEADFGENIYNAATQVFISPTTLDKSIEMCIKKYSRTNSIQINNEPSVKNNESFSSSFFEAATQPVVENPDENTTSSSRMPETDIIECNIPNVISEPSNNSSKEGSAFDDNFYNAATQVALDPRPENEGRMPENENCKTLEIPDAIEYDILNVSCKSSTSTTKQEPDFDDNFYNAATQVAVNRSPENSSETVDEADANETAHSKSTAQINESLSLSFFEAATQPYVETESEGKPLSSNENSENEKVLPLEGLDSSDSDFLKVVSKSPSNASNSTSKDVVEDNFNEAATQAVVNTEIEAEKMECPLEDNKMDDSDYCRASDLEDEINDSFTKSFYEAATQPVLENNMHTSSNSNNKELKNNSPVNILNDTQKESINSNIYFADTQPVSKSEDILIAAEFNDVPFNSINEVSSLNKSEVDSVDIEKAHEPSTDFGGYSKNVPRQPDTDKTPISSIYSGVTQPVVNNLMKDIISERNVVCNEFEDNKVEEKLLLSVRKGCIESNNSIILNEDEQDTSISRSFFELATQPVPNDELATQPVPNDELATEPPMPDNDELATEPAPDNDELATEPVPDNDKFATEPVFNNDQLATEPVLAQPSNDNIEVNTKGMSPICPREPTEDNDPEVHTKCTSELRVLPLTINAELCNNPSETSSRPSHVIAKDSDPSSNNCKDDIERSHNDKDTSVTNNKEIKITEQSPNDNDHESRNSEEEISTSGLHSKSGNKIIDEEEFTKETLNNSLQETVIETLSQKHYNLSTDFQEVKSVDQMETSMELSDSIFTSSTTAHMKSRENVAIDDILSQKVQMPNETIQGSSDMSISCAHLVDVLTQEVPKLDCLETKVSEDYDDKRVQHSSTNELKLTSQQGNSSQSLQNEKLTVLSVIDQGKNAEERDKEIIEDTEKNVKVSTIDSNLINVEQESFGLIKRGRQLFSQEFIDHSANVKRCKRLIISDESEQSSEELVIKFKKKGCNVFPPDTQDLIESGIEVPLKTALDSVASSSIIEEKPSSIESHQEQSNNDKELNQSSNNDSQISSEEFNVKFSRNKANVFPQDSEPIVSLNDGDDNGSHNKITENSSLISPPIDEISQEKSSNENKKSPRKSKSPASKDSSYVSRGNITLYSQEVLEELEEQFRMTEGTVIATQLSVASDSEEEVLSQENMSPIVRRSERKLNAKAIYKPLANSDDVQLICYSNQVTDSELTRKKSSSLVKNSGSTKSRTSETDEDTHNESPNKTNMSTDEIKPKSVKKFKKVTPTKKSRNSNSQKDSVDTTKANVDAIKKESLDFNDSADSNSENGEFGRGKRKRTKTSFDGFVLDEDFKKANKKSSSPSSVKESTCVPAGGVVKVENPKTSKDNSQSDPPATSRNRNRRALLHDFNKSGNSSQSSQEYSKPANSGLKKNSVPLMADNDEDDLIIMPSSKPNANKLKIVKKENDHHKIDDKNKSANDTSIKSNSISFSDKLDELFNIWGPADRVKLSPRAAKRSYSASNTLKSNTKERSSNSNSLIEENISAGIKPCSKENVSKNKNKNKKNEVGGKSKMATTSTSTNDYNSKKAGSSEAVSSQNSKTKHKAKSSCDEEPVIKRSKKSSKDSEQLSIQESSNPIVGTRRSARSQTSLPTDEKVESNEDSTQNTSDKIPVNSKRKRPRLEKSSSDSPVNDFYILSQEFSFREPRGSIKSPIREEFKPPTLPIRRSARAKVSEKKTEKKDPEKVLFTGLPNNKLSGLVSKLGGEVVESPFTCTVLITDKVRRTAKFLSALSRGLPIVTPEWLTSSTGAFADVNEFILSDIEAESRFSFNLKESIEKARGKKLLDGWSVYITPSVSPSVEEVKSIIECSGGKWLVKEPGRWPPNSFIISCKEDKDKWKSLMKRGRRPLVVEVEALFSGILKQNLELDQYRLI